MSYRLPLLAVAAFFPLSVQATIVPLQDRVIFHSNDYDKRLLIVNNNNRAPALLQSWIDDGSAAGLNKEQDYPFVVVPPVINMTPEKIVNLKILPTEKIHGLPTDRESIFWINLYEIPGVKKSQLEKEQSKIEVGLNSQLKVIYRPFKGEADLQHISATMTFRITDKGQALELGNTSPYYVTPVAIKIKSSSGEQSVKLDMNRMIAPFSTKHFSLDKKVDTNRLTVDYTLVADGGKDIGFSKNLN